jgi:hypothetical protein
VAVALRIELSIHHYLEYCHTEDSEVVISKYIHSCELVMDLPDWNQSMLKIDVGEDAYSSVQVFP